MFHSYEPQHQAPTRSHRGQIALGSMVAGGLALITLAVVALSTPGRATADLGVDPAQFAAACRQAQSWPQQTPEADFLDHCVRALTPPSQGPTSSPTGPGTPTAGPTSTPPMSTPPASSSSPGSPSPTGPSSPTPTATPTSPPPAPSAWPDRTNTGYKNAPGYLGVLTNFTGTLQSNHTYKFMRFPVGFTVTNVSNVTFYGCRFDGLESQGFKNVGLSGGANIVFDYSSFIPRNVTAPPVAHDQSSQWGIWEDTQNPPLGLTIKHSEFWGFGNAIGFMGNQTTAAAPFTISDSYIHDARADGNEDHTDGILNNVNNPSSGQYINIIHNTIVSKGNTNGIALQDTRGDRHVLIQNNYLSGWGYMVQAGGPGNQDVQFIDNVFGTDLKPDWGFMYGWWAGPGNVFRNNRIHFVPGTDVVVDGRHITAADEGRYVWPDNTIHATDYTGA